MIVFPSCSPLRLAFCTKTWLLHISSKTSPCDAKKLHSPELTDVSYGLPTVKRR